MGEFQLSEEQLKQVMERAIDLDSKGHGRRSWDLEAIEALGAEIGVSSTAIKAAWIEASTTGAPLPFAEHLDDRSPIVTSRTVDGEASSVLAAVQRWLHDAGYEPARHSATSALLERARRRRRHRLGGIAQVVVEVRPLPSERAECHVRIALARSRPGRTRLAHEVREATKGWLVFDGIVVLVSQAVTWEHGLLALPAVAAAGAGQGWWRARGKGKRIDGEARLAAEGILDVLEHRGAAAIDAATDGDDD